MKQNLYMALAYLNRSFNIIKPKRVLYWLGENAYGGQMPPRKSFKWYSDKWGLRFYLSPYYFLDREIISFGVYEAELCLFINKHIKSGMNCFDLGANMGFFSVMMGKAVGCQGRVYSFEPIPDIFSRLLNHIEHNSMQKHVEGHELAVSDRNGPTKINFGAQDLSNQGMGSIFVESTDLKRSIIINTVTIDDFVKANGIKKIDFMKFDIQGAETAALEGASETLKDMRPILCLEVSPTELAAADSTPKQFLKKICSFGYTVHYLTKKGDIGDVINCDGVSDDFSAGNVIAVPL